MDPHTAAAIPGPSANPPSSRPPELRWRRWFPGEERQLGVLREWLASLLPECPARDDVTSVASELGANAIRHTASGRGGWFGAEVTWYGLVVRVAVADAGAPTGPRVIDDPAAEHGRGLLIVRGLAVRTGTCGDQRGRLVWAEIPWTGPGCVALASSPYPHEAAIRDDETALARHFTSVPTWFGRSTLQWWALAGKEELLTAPTARELATRLSQALSTRSSTPSPPAANPSPTEDMPARMKPPGHPHPRAAAWFPDAARMTQSRGEDPWRGRLDGRDAAGLALAASSSLSGAGKSRRAVPAALAVPARRGAFAGTSRAARDRACVMAVCRCPAAVLAAAACAACC